MEQYTVPFFRFLLIFPLLYLTTAFMGRRSIGELPVIDFIVAITIGSVVGADIADPSIPHGPTIMMVVLIGITQYAVTLLKRKIDIIRDLTTLTPTVIIEKGRFLTHNIARIRYTVNDILPMLREQEIFNLSEVELAVIEPSGKLSVLKIPEVRPVNLKDMGRTPPPEAIPLLLIADGKIVPNALEHSNRDREWLDRELQKLGYTEVEAVYLAALESDGSFYASPKKQEYIGPSLHY